MTSLSATVGPDELASENRELRAQLREAEQALDAIRSGGVDALVVPLNGVEQVYTLEGAETPYRSFVEQMLEGAVSVSVSGTILYCNRRFAEILGRPLERVIGHRLHDFVVDFESVSGLLADAQWGSSRGELTLSADGDRPVPTLASVQRLRREASDLVMVVTDLTDIVAARMLVGALELRVDQRTAALVVKNQELEGFTYSVSHDMRTPLRAIVSNARIILAEEGGNVSEAGRENLSRLSVAALKLAQLIDDLLRYARLGVRDLVVEQFDLHYLILQAAAEVVCDRESFDLVINLPEPCSVEGDPRLFAMALRNILDNACKYRKSGCRSQVEVGMDESSGERIYSFRDNGIGFDMSYVNKLFVPFERLHRDTEYPGTGIGLANVRRAIERHGGRVWAEGELGVGATFYFTLP